MPDVDNDDTLRRSIRASLLRDPPRTNAMNDLLWLGLLAGLFLLTLAYARLCDGA
mgnify:CR=1 FL=1